MGKAADWQEKEKRGSPLWSKAESRGVKLQGQVQPRFPELPGTTFQGRVLGAQPSQFAFLIPITPSHPMCSHEQYPFSGSLEWVFAAYDQKPKQHAQHANRKQAFLINHSQKILNSPSI